ncbi:MAG: Ribosome-binding factor A [Parcubacteria group bacterium GW2011_GWF2_43_11]|nr:MAG: Ribosome-binding factor A [Parcubacteria group bacterium GW2011_GWF2_43_11]
MERIPQVNQLIKKELGQIILREGDFSKNVLVTITRVETSRNLIDTRVYVSVLPETQSRIILATLNRRIFHLQQMLNKRLRMRPIPKIRFLEEKQTAEAGKIEQLLQEIKDQKNG